MATSDQDDIDPTGAQTPEAFMDLLRQARTASGLSVVDIAQRARQRGYDLDPIDLSQALNQSTLPTWQTVTGVLTACGLVGMQIDRWMRVYHDLAAPAQPLAPPMPQDATAAQEAIEDLEPVSVPPLILSTASATPSRLKPQHLAIAGGAVLALLLVPLVLMFTVFGGDPDTVTADSTKAAPQTVDTVPPAPSPTDQLVTEPSPTEPAAVPTTPEPAPTTAKPRTTAPPPPPPPTNPAVLRSGQVALDHRDGFDLDNGQTFGVQDISRQNDDSLNGLALKPVAGEPGKQTCQGIQDWQQGADHLNAGQWLCVRTSSGRYGRLLVTATGSTIKLSYTVWL